MKPTQPVKKPKYRIVEFRGGKRDGQSLWVDVSKARILMPVVGEAQYLRRSIEVYVVSDDGSQAVYKNRRMEKEWSM